MSVRLVDIGPRWINYGDRKGVGISFECMARHCGGRIRVLFANPLDGGQAWPDDEQHGGGPYRWHRSGETFETLSMTPSVDADVCGHMTLTNGVFG